MSETSASHRHSFSVSMIAPDGLACMEEHLAATALPLVLWRSGYNGKHILRSAPGSARDFDLDMDSNDDDCMFASGAVRGGLDDAARLLESLSTCLRAASVPHEILLDDPKGALAKRWGWRWLERKP